MGPTIAERLSVEKMGPGRYLDIDPSLEDRQTFGIPACTNDPLMLGSPMTRYAYYDEQFHEAHAKREIFWVQQMGKYKYSTALVIVGQNHTLSLAFRLVSQSFDVKTFTYAPSSYAKRV